MPLQEFWNEDPDLLWVYRNSYLDKMEADIKMMNYNAWLQGLYISSAVASVFSKGHKYFKEPIDFGKKDNKKSSIAEKILNQANKAKTILQ